MLIDLLSIKPESDSKLFADRSGSKLFVLSISGILGLFPEVLFTFFFFDLLDFGDLADLVLILVVDFSELVSKDVALSGSGSTSDSPSFGTFFFFFFFFGEVMLPVV
jgi:hypothetical protein